MIELAASHSTHLIRLIQTGAVAVDWVQVGGWMTPEEIRLAQEQMPELRFLYHTGNPPSAEFLLLGTLSLTHSPWASIHINLLPPGALKLALRYGIGLPHASPAWHTRRFLQKTGRLAAQLPIPLLLENMPGMHHLGYGYESEAERITQILQDSGYNLLLDIAHARVAAAGCQAPISEYLNRLPLDRVIEIHLSGPRWKQGRLADAHEPLQQEDYEILDWTLARCRPKLVTLEYFRNAAELEMQLRRLREILE